MEVGNRLHAYLYGNQYFFKTIMESNYYNTRLFVESIMISDLNNIERISETLDAEYHKIQHSISDSNWNAGSGMDQVIKNVARSLPKQTLTGLLIDESGWVKKRNKSLGVSYHFCGNTGKTANSQVALFGCLCNGKNTSLVDSRLYLLKSWTTYTLRCDRVEVPSNERKFKIKPELAIDIIKHQLSLGITFDYVGAYALHGNDITFAREFDHMEQIYRFDVHFCQPIYLQKPELFLTECKTNKGLYPKKQKVSTDYTTISKYISTLQTSDWKTIDIRHSAKGVLKGQFHFKTVYIWAKSTIIMKDWLLVVFRQKTKKGVGFKYSLINADLVQYSEQVIAYMQAQRFFVEHSFKEKKQILGLVPEGELAFLVPPNWH